MDLADELIQASQLPLYANKHSRKDFTNHELFKLLVLKTYLQQDYRRFVEWLEVSTIPKELDLRRIPHFTTLQKFAQRQNLQKLEKLLKEFVDMSPKQMRSAGVDSTGFGFTSASKHYEKRINKRIEKKDFMKSLFFFDLNNLLILGVKTRKKTRHDMHDMKFFWPKINRFKFEIFYGDKAFDANWLHELLFESGRKSKIHLKQEGIPIWRTKGEYRKKAKLLCKNKHKGKRSLCETIIFMLKKVYGSCLTARTLATQKVELLFKVITFNLERIYKLRHKVFLLLNYFLDFLYKILQSRITLSNFQPISG